MKTLHRLPSGRPAREPRADHTRPRGLLRLGTGLLAVLVCAGCNLGPRYTRPTVETPSAFKELTPAQLKETDGWKTAEPKDAVLRGNWWEAFHDPTLNTLEEQVRVSNQTVAAAMASFTSARALVRQARSGLFPTVSINPSASRTRQPVGGAGPRGAVFSNYTLPLDASWESDLWGSIRNTVNASTYEAQASAADLENLRLTLQAEVAADYFQLQAQDAQRQILDSTVLAYEESAKLVRARYQTGIASDEDVAQAETQLRTTQAAATDLGIQRAEFEHAIATLIGKPPAALGLPTKPLTPAPVGVPFGLPSSLLERRPDIAAAERRVAEANARIGVAKAAFFPALTLNGSAGFSSSALQTLVNWPSLAWSVGAGLGETLFDAGKRRGLNEQAQAAYDAAVANYRQTVLNAFQEVEDALARLRLLSQERQQQDAAVQSAQRLLALATDRYKLGIDSYLNVITAQTTLLSSRRTQISLRMEQMTATVQLIKAVGGGWDATHLPSPEKVAARSPTPPAASPQQP